MAKLVRADEVKVGRTYSNGRVAETWRTARGYVAIRWEGGQVHTYAPEHVFSEKAVDNNG